MRLGRVLDWQTEVLQTWKNASPPGFLPAEELIAELPDNVCWMLGKIEPADVPNIMVIAATDWIDLFGAFDLRHIANNVPEEGDDAGSHFSRIRNLTEISKQNGRMHSPILIAKSGAGPFVIVDGNHRVVAMCRAGNLVGKHVIVGFHYDVDMSYERYVNAIRYRYPKSK